MSKTVSTIIRSPIFPEDEDKTRAVEEILTAEDVAEKSDRECKRTNRDGEDFDQTDGEEDE